MSVQGQYYPLVNEDFEWNMLSQGIISFGSTQYFEGDTLIDDVTYNKFISVLDLAPGSPVIDALIREDVDNQIVYAYFSGVESQLYDFDVAPGDLVATVVFGCETKCHPDKEKSLLYPKLDVEFPYLNSGMYIGQAWALRYCLSDYKYNDADDDQRFWTHKFLNYPSLIGLDYENKLFLNTEGVKLEEIILKDDVASYKNSNPQFIHINGPDKTQINNFTKK